MENAKPLPTPTDEEILIDEESIAGVKIHPWNLGQIVKLTPVLELVAVEMKRRHLTLGDFMDKSDPQNVKIINVDQLIFSIVPFLPQIMSISLEMDVEQVNGFSQNKMLAILTTIIKQNAGYLKNYFALISAAVTTFAI